MTQKNPILLIPSKAFTPGAVLWILDHQGAWHSKIDWYLSFNMKKLKQKKLKPLNIPKTFKSTGWPLNKASINKASINKAPIDKAPVDKAFLDKLALDKLASPAPLLMHTSDRLPNLWTVELTFISTQQWLNQGHKIWQYLNRPTLRIFAPQKVTKKDINQAWGGVSEPAIQYIMEEG